MGERRGIGRRCTASDMADADQGSHLRANRTRCIAAWARALGLASSALQERVIAGLPQPAARLRPARPRPHEGTKATPLSGGQERTNFLSNKRMMHPLSLSSHTSKRAQISRTHRKPRPLFGKSGRYFKVVGVVAWRCARNGNSCFLDTPTGSFDPSAVATAATSVRNSQTSHFRVTAEGCSPQPADSVA